MVDAHCEMWFSLRPHDCPPLGDRFDDACSMATDASGEGLTGESFAHSGGTGVSVGSVFSGDTMAGPRQARRTVTG